MTVLRLQFAASVIIPDSVEAIEDMAFYGCGALTSFVIPKHVTRIGKCAFDRCVALKLVNVPSSTSFDGECVGKYECMCIEKGQDDFWRHSDVISLMYANYVMHKIFWYTFISGADL